MKFIEVVGCYVCPLHQFNNIDGWKCVKANRLIPLIEKNFPKWCPLPDLPPNKIDPDRCACPNGTGSAIDPFGNIVCTKCDLPLVAHD